MNQPFKGAKWYVDWVKRQEGKPKKTLDVTKKSKGMAAISASRKGRKYG